MENQKKEGRRGLGVLIIIVPTLIALFVSLLSPVFSAPVEDDGETATGDAAATGGEVAEERVAQAAQKKRASVNQFNRLMKNPMSEMNASPAEDGIHDTDNPGTHVLQAPSQAFEGLPRTRDGNKVDWVKALQSGLIKPRYELDDPDAESFTMDMTIIREVKGSMPNVVFPHQEHTEWLDCSNCHDEIFVPEKGANQISMAGILMGQQCGVCHGKVAFPVTDCKRCHAQPKSAQQLHDLAEGSK